MKFIIPRVGQKFMASVIALIFVTIGLVGAQWTMNMDEDGKMQNCPFFGQFQELCPMTGTQHASEWKQLFLAAFETNTLSSLLLVLAAIASSFMVAKQLRFLVPSSIPITSQYLKPPIESNHILRAFGQGILRKRE